MIELSTRSAEETSHVGEKIAACLRPGSVVLLHGDLGAGKTMLVKGAIEALVPGDRAASPTFTIHTRYERPEEYGGSVDHIDLYRLGSAEDLESVGYGELLESSDSVVFIEWPERSGDWLPDRYLLVDFTFETGDNRLLSISEQPTPGLLLACLQKAFGSC